MEQIAELGYFVIKTIETYNVDETIALSKKTGKIAHWLGFLCLA